MGKSIPGGTASAKVPAGRELGALWRRTVASAAGAQWAKESVWGVPLVGRGLAAAPCGSGPESGELAGV